MKAHEKLEAEEYKLEKYFIAHSRCHYCNKLLRYTEAELAHRIPKTKLYLKKYGPEIIHHDKNMFITCDKCNSKALLDPKTHPLKAEKLIEEIKLELKK